MRDRRKEESKVGENQGMSKNQHKTNSSRGHNAHLKPRTQRRDPPHSIPKHASTVSTDAFCGIPSQVQCRGNLTFSAVSMSDVLTLDLWNPCYEPHFVVKFIYSLVASNLKIIKPAHLILLGCYPFLSFLSFFFFSSGFLLFLFLFWFWFGLF